MARDPYKYFRIEARELIDQLSRGTLDLEKESNPGLVAQLLRLAHTLKGAARVVRCRDIGDRAHAIEDTLAPLRDSDQRATPAQIDALLRDLDAINSGIATLSAPETAPESTPLSLSPTVSPLAPVSVQLSMQDGLNAARIDTEEALRTVRIDTGEMDTLLDGLAEVHAVLGSLRAFQRHTASVRDLANTLGTHLASRPGHVMDGRANDIDKRRTQDLAAQIAASSDGLQRNFTSGIDRLDRELKRVRDAAEKMRLIPTECVFVSLERAARDAAQLQNKQIAFEVHGGAIRLDAQILGKMQGALAHAVRNAVVHGIETASEREGAGKSPQGKVTIEVSQRSQHTVFTCNDDGRGIDLDAVRRAAEQRGLPAGAARPTDDRTLLQLLLRGGISTLGTITEVAGRGVGLDAVRDAIEQLQGKIDLSTRLGCGTTLTLSVPLSVAALEGLQVESAGVVAIIPIDAVTRTLRVAPAEIASTAQGESMIHDDRNIPFLPLARLLSNALPNTTSSIRNNRTWSVVIVKADCGLAAIGVDRLLGATDIVLRPLPALTPAKAIVAGATLDMEGNPQLVLDPTTLVTAAQHAGTEPTNPEEARIPILVIDDSLTTRMLERSILESAGYEVELAVSGEEAMEKAGHNRYALFLVDVEMPGMDGFTFIERTRADPQLRDIPAILVTSRASPEDLQRGRDVGASGHIVKSEFDQGVLLTRIGELVR